MNQRQAILGGAMLGLAGVALGAFGAHALKALLTANGRLETYDLAVRYQFYHAFSLLIIGSFEEKIKSPGLRWASLFMFTGVVMFSGSLYGFALTNLTGFAIITPFGGLLMLMGWAALTYSIFSKKWN